MPVAKPHVYTSPFVVHTIVCILEQLTPEIAVPASATNFFGATLFSAVP